MWGPQAEVLGSWMLGFAVRRCGSAGRRAGGLCAFPLYSHKCFKEKKYPANVDNLHFNTQESSAQAPCVGNCPVTCQIIHEVRA